MSDRLKAPFPWFGGKSRAADLIWARFGPVRNYVEPFAGSLAVLLARPHPPGIETINDLDCYVANFWRAVSIAPDEVALWADAPVNEADLHARHAWLVGRTEFRERMKVDPEYFDARIAGWWCWGLSCWIGGGWCALPKPGVNLWRKRPQTDGRKDIGIQQRPASLSRQKPDINAMCDKAVNNNTAIAEWFLALQERLRRVRVCCGDWSRVTGPTPMGLTSNVPPGFVTGVLLDPPYAGDIRNPNLYATESGTVSADVRKWAIENGDNPKLRIALCGYEGEHEMPDAWACVPWKAAGGYSNQSVGNGNAALERVWFSPHCMQPEPELFEINS